MEAERAKRIKELQKEKDVVILAHYYVDGAVQEIADYVGDSFYLSKVATKVPQKTILFAGVTFMGESAKILNPDKTVVMADECADCPMAHMVTKETVQAARDQYDDLAVVCYINSTQEIKSWSDVCVTSANAVKIVKNLPNKHILFIPDRNLAHFVAAAVPEKEFIYNEGFCIVHEFMQVEELLDLKAEHPDAKVLVHPECNHKIIEIADFIGSTSGIINFAGESSDKEFIIGTECGVLTKLKERRPDAEFYFPETTPTCVNMKKITPEKVLHVLKTGENEIHARPETEGAAKNALARMLELAGK